MHKTKIMIKTIIILIKILKKLIQIQILILMKIQDPKIQV